jgi:hypothetical protein
MLAQLTAELARTTIREAAIPHPDLWVLGVHDLADGSITLNVELCRVLVGLHELTHKVWPAATEAEVWARSTEILHALTDDDITALDVAIRARVAECARRPRRRASAPRG